MLCQTLLSTEASAAIVVDDNFVYPTTSADKTESYALMPQFSTFESAKLSVSKMFEFVARKERAMMPVR